MPSPFPGMNPYLERQGVWHGFHEQFVIRCLEALVPQIRPNYVVQTDENVYIHELDAGERRLVGRPDNFIADRELSLHLTRDGGAALAAPLYSRVPAVDEERLTYLKIVDRHGRQLVTVIELLSPSNKESYRADYLAKRQHYLKSGVGLVELDLLRGGHRLPVENPPECDYCVMVVRPDESPRVGVWPLMLRSPLPEIPIPLRIADGDAKINLQELLHGVYDAGGYQDYIYDELPAPPLNPADLEWAKQYAQGQK